MSVIVDRQEIDIAGEAYVHVNQAAQMLDMVPSTLCAEGRCRTALSKRLRWCKPPIGDGHQLLYYSKADVLAEKAKRDRKAEKKAEIQARKARKAERRAAAAAAISVPVDTPPAPVQATQNMHVELAAFMAEVRERLTGIEDILTRPLQIHDASSGSLVDGK